MTDTLSPADKVEVLTDKELKEITRACDPGEYWTGIVTRDLVARLLATFECAQAGAKRLTEENEQLRFTLEVATSLGDFHREEIKTKGEKLDQAMTSLGALRRMLVSIRPTCHPVYDEPIAGAIALADAVLAGRESELAERH